VWLDEQHCDEENPTSPFRHETPHHQETTTAQQGRAKMIAQT
jgi:hypothetical protein